VNRASVVEHDVAHRGQSQADATGVAIAGGLDPIERLEHPRLLRLGNSRAIVIDFEYAFLCLSAG